MANPTPLHVEQEIRFAVVMYGGVSLAIYINGVTQELLRMVRATAGDPADEGFALLPDDELSGSEKVYRELGQLLGKEPGDTDGAIHTQFKIDILSGTSAGGINAVFLAKALTNGQSIDELQKLWIGEGDIEKLLNDGQFPLTGLGQQAPPKSLLNSQRMYVKLLEAFDQMDGSDDGQATPSTPFVDEVDLFVTTTDINGLVVPLRLADGLVNERRHRNFFHFEYRKPAGVSAPSVNDFGPGNNAFLAFASRCTSAFPFAFEPMKLSDVDEVLRTKSRHQSEVGHGLEKWSQYFPAYDCNSTVVAESIGMRPFGDGGYLDNKPFGYAIDAMALRSANLPVDRKLIYIEPDPESLLGESQVLKIPNAIENVSAALSLARYETIREDLQRILDRNRLIKRVDQILSGINDDVRLEICKPPLHDDNFRQLDVGSMIQSQGVAYGGYHRLKVSAVSDEIAKIIAHHAGFDKDCDEFLAIRYLVRHWRDSQFEAYPGDHLDVNGRPQKKSENEMLFLYDMGYRLRRLDFVLKKIVQLHRLDESSFHIFKQQKDVVGKENLVGPTADPANKKQFREELRVLHRQFGQVAAKLRGARDTILPPMHRKVRSADGTGKRVNEALAEAIAGTGLDSAQLREILKITDEAACRKYVEDLFHQGTTADSFKKVADTLAGLMHVPMDKASKDCHRILEVCYQDEATTPVHLARKLVKYYYEYFDHFDLISFPILFSTEVGDEMDEVDVIRISPVDATSLDGGRLGRRKLGGNTLMNFGGFLDRGWRENDILWGKLDGSERIIRSLLAGTPHKDLGDGFIKRAHELILEEHFQNVCRSEVCGLLAKLANSDPATEMSIALRQIARPELGSLEHPAHRALLAPYIDKASLYSFFRNLYVIDPTINPRLAVSSLARSTQIMGQLFEDLSDEYRLNRNPAAWVARLGRVFWGLVEVAVPGSLKNKFFTHWIYLLYIFEIVVLIGGVVLINRDVQQFGLTALVITALTHGATAWLGDFMQGKRRAPDQKRFHKLRSGRWWAKLAIAVLVLLIVCLAVFVAAVCLNLAQYYFEALVQHAKSLNK